MGSGRSAPRKIKLVYTSFGILFGLVFPVGATMIDIWAQSLPSTLSSVAMVQTSQPLHWIIDTAPLFLGIFAWAAGKRQAMAVSLNSRLEQKYLDLQAASEALAGEMEERVRLETRLRHSQKLESLGRLAGGVAHDFNNLLTVISGYTSILLSEGQVTTEVRGSLDEISKAAEQAASLTQQLLAFSRNQAAEPVLADMTREVEKSRKMLKRLIGEEFALQVNDPGEPCPIRIDKHQLGQVLINLVVNARDAMPGGGTVNVRLDLVSLAEEECGHLTEAYAGDFVRLTVRDSGCGMDEEVKANLFEPFFTTKGPNRGTGLGLSTVYGIVRQNQGFIEVVSEPGTGSTFEIFFPRVDGSFLKSSAVREGHGQPGSETVLLVEDDPQIRALSSRTLTGNGYEVFAASSAEEALEIWSTRGECVQILVSDVVLPGLNGKELSSRLLIDRPDLPVIFVSGYGANLIDHYGLLASEVEFLQKPFTPSALINRVRLVLDASRT